MRYLLRELEAVHGMILKSKKIYIMLDFDGTLTPITNDPRLVTLSVDTKSVLRQLSIDSRFVLVIISGRSMDDVRELVDVEGCVYVGNHGLEMSGPALSFVHADAAGMSKLLLNISSELTKTVSKKRGLIIEDKRLTMSVHYRNVPRQDVPGIRAAVRKVVRRHKSVEITYGKKVMEVRPRISWNKGTAANWLIERFGDGLPLYFGDDRTDEDAFSALRYGITVLVSQKWRSSNAKYYVKSTEEVVAFLKSMISPE